MVNNLLPAKPLLLFRTCQTETVLSRYTEKETKGTMYLETATTINSHPSFYNPKFYGLCMWRL